MLKRFLTAFIFAAAMLILTSCAPYTLTFDPNGGDGEAASVVYEEAESFSLPAEPVRASYSFKGWYYDRDIWGEPFDADEVKADATLYARWERNRYSVTFNLGGGETSEGKSRDYTLLCYEGDAIAFPEVTNESRLFMGWSLDGENAADSLPDTVNADVTFTALWGKYYDRTDLVLPKLYITTKNGYNGEYMKCTIGLTASVKADEQYEFSSLSGGIKVRGNSTAGFEKKPYHIKLDMKQNMLGLGADKDWILLANYIDISLMRNWTVFELSKHFQDIYTSDSRWVHVFYNGSYDGVYLLCEQVESGKNRVDIEWDEETGAPNDPSEVGFLVEFGHPGGGDGNKTISTKTVKYKGQSWNLDGGMGEIKYPAGSDCTRQMQKYLEDYVNSVNDAIFKRDWQAFTELCDVDSFVRNFIISEYMLSNDMGWVFFFYKEPGGKLFLGPIWDFDQAAGCSEYGGATWEGWASGSPHNWFIALIETTEFRALVTQLWEESSDYLHSVPDMIRAKANEYSADIECNFMRWPYMIGYSHWRSLPDMDKFRSYEEHVEYLCGWIEKRMTWIENRLQ